MGNGGKTVLVMLLHIIAVVLMCDPFWVKTHPDILAADPDVPVMQSMIGGVIIRILFATVLGAIWFGVGYRREGRPYYYR